jgi:iron complex outermembrane recepter protein
MRVCVAAVLAGGVLLSASAAVAQQAEPQVSPEPAAPPPSDPATLPEVVVDTTKEKKVTAKKKKPKAKNTSTTQAIGAPSPGPQTGTTGRGAESAVGPVKNYNATSTATGTKTDTPLSEVPQSISVVGAEQIRDMGAQTLQEVLRYTAGVVADAYGLDSRADSTFIRGMDPVDYLDGLRRTFSYYTYSYRIDPFFLERAEVLRGPASVLFGQSTVGGIINSVSKRPQQEEGGEFTVEYGTFDYKQVKFDMTGPASEDGKWSYRLTGLARDADTQVDYVEDDRYAIQPEITFRPDSDTAITVIGHFQKDEAGLTGQFYPHVGTIYPNVNGRRISRDRFVGEPGDHYDTDVASGTLLVEHKFNSFLKLQHASRYADIHNDYDSTYADWSYLDADEEQLGRWRYIAFTDTQIFDQDTNLEARFVTAGLAHRVLGGVDYSHFKAQTDSGWAYNATPFDVYNPVYGQPADYWSYYPCGTANYTQVSSVPICSHTNQEVMQTGLYVQDQMRLGNWIGVAGARKDWIENEADGAGQRDDAVSYRAALMYEFASGFTPYISYGESFIPVVGTTSPANGKHVFSPQQGRMYELGFKYQPTGSNFAINGAVYDIAESNRLMPDPDDQTFTYSVQVGGVSIKGFELELTGRLSENLKAVASYAYTDAKYDDGVVIVDPTYTFVDVGGNQLESVPKHVASLWGVWEFDQPQLKGWSVGGGVRYVGASWDASNTIKVPNVTLFDAMIAYEEDNWRWSINGKNLEDKEYYTTCLNRGDCFVGSARTILTSLTYRY